ncbi:MAG: hypothetical protein J5903_01930, partial [Clostridia bacterium]|nr:hypothetical protein [Clostridia bacterium]
MNKTESKTNFKAILLLLIALMLSIVLAVSTACGEDATDSTSSSASDSSTTEETPTDEQTLKNGDFEFNTTSTSSYPVSTTSIQWKRTTDSDVKSAPASTASSGIIDTADDAWGKLADANKPVDADDKTYNPHTPFYDEAVAAVNDEDTEVNEAGTKILMIHNKVSTEGQGTAQYFTSSTTLSLAANEYGKLSVWVRTDNLKTLQHTNEYGAYIKVNNTMGSAISPLVLKNINTQGKWVKYTIYLKPSDYAKTEYVLVLGLGMGDSVNKEELCEGFAFFDNAEFNVIEESEYNEQANTYAKSLSAFDIDYENEVSVYDNNNETLLDDKGKNAGLFTFDQSANDGTIKEYYYFVNFAKASAIYNVAGGALEFNKVNPNNSENGYAVTEYEGQGYTAAAKALDGDVNVPERSVYMDFRAGRSSATYTTPVQNVESGEYYKISFTANVTGLSSAQKASVTVVEDGKDTAAHTNFATDGEDVIYTVYLTNSFPDDKYPGGIPYSLKFSYGPTEL